MVKLNLKRIGTAGIYGAIDIAAELADEKLVADHPNIVKDFQNVTDLSRAAAFLTGIGAPYVTNDPRVLEYTDVLQTSSLPLLEKSVYRTVKNLMAEPRGRVANRLVLRKTGSLASAQTIVRQTPGNMF